MKKQITNVSPVQTAKVMAILYLVMSLPIVLLMMAFMPSMGMGKMMLLIAPVIYMVIGFIFTLIGSFIYNFVAGLVGGFEFTVTEVRD
jgi:hypothetical protein